MLYVPGKFLFIHIPRTAGNAITRTLAKSLIQTDDVMLVTANESQPIHRHSTAAEMRDYVSDWDSITRIAIDRPTDQIIASDYRLHHSMRDPVPAGLAESVRLAKCETLPEFAIRRWQPWLAGRTAWGHWCCDDSGADLMTHRFSYIALGAVWQAILDVAGVEGVELPRMDWQAGGKMFPPAG